MADPLGLIGNTGITPSNPLIGAPPPAGAVKDGPGFRAMLEEQIAKVNELESDAKQALEDLATGRAVQGHIREDVAGVKSKVDKIETDVGDIKTSIGVLIQMQRHGNDHP